MGWDFSAQFQRATLLTEYFQKAIGNGNSRDSGVPPHPSGEEGSSSVNFDENDQNLDASRKERKMDTDFTDEVDKSKFPVFDAVPK